MDCKDNKGETMNNTTVINLKKEIEAKRSYLNRIVVEQIEKVEIIRVSQELDTLITEYMYRTI